MPPKKKKYNPAISIRPRNDNADLKKKLQQHCPGDRSFNEFLEQILTKFVEYPYKVYA